jgi:uncharacterized repeat protein (TIGR01451 family)
VTSQQPLAPRSILNRLFTGALLAVLVVAAMSWAAPAQAGVPLDGGTSPLPGSNFQGADANMETPSAAEILAFTRPLDGYWSGSAVDWQNFIGTDALDFAPDASGAKDTWFFHGKEEKPNTWDFQEDTVTPDKSDILGAWTTTTPGENDTFLNLAFTRTASGGTTFFNFELNQSTETWWNGKYNAYDSDGDGTIETSGPNGDKTIIPCRIDGDLIVSFTLSGNTGDVGVEVREWTSDVTVNSALGTPCGAEGSFQVAKIDATGKLDLPTTPPDPPNPLDGLQVAQGAMNPVPAPGDPALKNLFTPDPNDTLPGDTFGEASLNLSKILASLGSDSCFDFGRISMHTRSSAPFTADLKDFVAPVPIEARSCTISGTKYHDRNGDGSKGIGEEYLEGFRIYADINGDGDFDPATEGDFSSITDENGVWSIGELGENTTGYEIREDLSYDPDGAGGQGTWAAEGWTCTDPSTADSPAVDFASATEPCTFVVPLSDGANEKGLAFGNWKQPQLKVVKSLSPTTDGGLFDLRIDGVTKATDRTHNGNTGFQNVTAGDHTVSEVAGTGTDLANYTASTSCVKNGGAAVASATVSASSGDSIVCTITNTRKAGTLRLEKQTIPASDTGTFVYKVNGTAVNNSDGDAQFGNGDSVEIAKNASDTFTVSEHDGVGSLSDYTSTYSCKVNGTDVVTAGTGTSISSVPIQPDKTTVCKFVNTRKGTIAIKKTGLGGTGSFSFSGTPAIGPVNTGSTSTAVSVVPGNYSYTEDLKDGWKLTDLACTDAGQTADDNSNVSVLNRTAEFDVQPGENVVCEFTNTKNGSIAIKKTGVGGTGSFAFTAAGTAPAIGPVTTGDTSTAVSVEPGNYSYTEDLKDGWKLTDLSCTDSGQTADDNSNVSVLNRSAEFDVQPGENVVCEFTNTKNGSIAIKKTGIGGTGSFAFTAAGSAPAIGPVDTGSTSTAVSVEPGNYSYTEDLKDGWKLTDLSCTDSGQAADDNSNVSVANRSTEFDVQPGENVVCEFTNTKGGSIAIKKTGVGGTGSFSFTPTGSAPAIGPVNAGSTSTAVSVEPGNYTYTEDLKDGWKLTDLSCTDSGQTADDNSNVSVANRTAEFDVQPGENIVCEFTNTKNGSIAIKKTGVGGTGTFSFTANGGAPTIGPVTTGDTSTAVSVEPGNYSYTEDLKDGWKLTALSCTDSGQTADDNSNVSVVNRTADFDVQPGENVVCEFTNTKGGSIAIKKTGVGGDGSFAFTANGGAPAIGPVTTGTTSSAVPVEPGTYSYTEDLKSGWKLTDLSCTDSAQDDADDSDGNVGTRTAVFNVQPGENVVCEFTNTKNGSIAIKKTGLGGDGSFAFTANGGALAIGPVATGATSPAVSVEPGNYSYTEDLKDGWKLTDLSCTDAAQDDADDSDGTVGTRTAVFDVQPGETVVCEFTNTKNGTIAIKKTGVGGDGTFSFTAGGSAPAIGPVATGATSPAVSVEPGNYSYTEDLKDGWKLTDLSCTDAAQDDADDSNVSVGDRSADFDVQPGENVVCEFTNTKSGSIAIKKTGVGGDGTFSFTAGGSAPAIGPVATGATSAAVPVEPGNYSYTEDTKDGWKLTDLSCTDGAQEDADDSNVSVANRSAEFDVQPGENVVCEFTNTKNGSIAIKKTGVGGEGTFSFTAGGSAPAIGPVATGATSPAVSVEPGNYSYTEDTKAGWKLTGLSCTDAAQEDADDSNVSVGNRSAEFDVQPGENVVCEFTNTRNGTIAIKKTGIGGTGSFAFTAGSGAPAIGPVSTGSTSSAVSVEPGNYSYTENANADWALTDLSCTDAAQDDADDSNVSVGSRSAEFDVQPGENVVCEFTNTRLGTINIKKLTPDPDPTTEFDFAGSAGLVSKSDLSPADFDLKSGETKTIGHVFPNSGANDAAYVITESDEVGYRLTGIDCKGDAGTVEDKASRAARIKVSPGETVTCEFTNLKLVVDVDVDKKGTDYAHHGDTVTYLFTVTNGGNTPLHDVAVSDRVITGPDTSATPCTVGSTPIEYKVDQNADQVLDPGDVFVYSCSYSLSDAHAATGETGKTDTKPGEITNIGSVTAKDEQNTTVPSQDSNPHVTTVYHPDVQLTKQVKVQGSAGDYADSVIAYENDVLLYRVDIKNTGDAPLTIDSVMDDIVDATPDNGCTLAGPTEVSGNGNATFEPGETWRYACSVPVTAAVDDFTNRATVKAHDPVPGDKGKVESTDTAATEVIRPSMDVEKYQRIKDSGLAYTQAKLNVHLGDVVEYKVELKNTGDTPIKTLAIGDLFCPLSSATGDGGVAGQLDVGETWTLTCSHTVVASDGADFVNTVTAVGEDKTGKPVTTPPSSVPTHVVDPKTVVIKEGNLVAYAGDQVTFTYDVSNGGNSPLSEVSVTDTAGAFKCTDVVRDPSGDKNIKTGDANATLDNPGQDGKTSESWRFKCTTTVPANHKVGDPALVNVATVVAKDELGKTVTSTDDHTTTIWHPLIAIDKTGPAKATAGDKLSYQLLVTNIGDVAFASQQVVVTDPKCDAPPVLVAKGRGTANDPTPDQLDPGDAWLYGCSYLSKAGETSVLNTATVVGTDPNGRVVRDDDAVTTALDQPQVAVLPETAVPGSARLSGPAACQSKAFKVTVRGKQMAKVTFYVDGKVYKRLTVSAAQAIKTRSLSVTINPRSSKAGVHRVKVRVTFVAKSLTKTKTMNLTYQRCARQVVKPQFTG